MAKPLVRIKLPKAKPMKPAAKPVKNRPAPPITQADLDRHARTQAMEQREARKLIRTTTDFRPTPMKKK